MRTLREIFRQLAPSWLTSGEGEKVLYSLGVVMDAALERARLSLRARYPQHAPPDAMAVMARDRRLVRGLDEPGAGFALRLLSWLDAHRTRGSAFALLRQIRAYCGERVMVRTVDTRGNWFSIDRDGVKTFVLNQANWDWDGGAATSWSRFWLIIYPESLTPAIALSASLPWALNGDWGDADLWTFGVWATPRKTIGTTATMEAVADLRRIVREWKPGGTRCEWIVIAYADTLFDPTDPPLTGTYGRWGKYVAGSYVYSRPSAGRYIAGVDGGYS